METFTGAAAGAVVGAAAGAVVGAAAGAVGGSLRHELVGRGFLKEAGEQIQPGRTVIVVISEPQHMESFKEAVPSAANIFSHAFASADADAIRAWLASAPIGANAQATMAARSAGSNPQA